MTPTAEFGNRADVLMADIPAGAKTSARAVARMYAALLGEVGGVRLLSPERLREVSTDTATGVAFALTKNRLTPDFDIVEQLAGVVTKAIVES